MILSLRKRTTLRERRERQAEKIRLEELRAKMSAKRLQRMKKVSERVDRILRQYAVLHSLLTMGDTETRAY